MSHNLKAGAKWLALILVSSIWVEAISRNLWWIIMTFVLAGAIYMMVGFLIELGRDDHGD